MAVIFIVADSEHVVCSGLFAHTHTSIFLSLAIDSSSTHSIEIQYCVCERCVWHAHSQKVKTWTQNLKKYEHKLSANIFPSDVVQTRNFRTETMTWL